MESRDLEQGFLTGVLWTLWCLGIGVVLTERTKVRKQEIDQILKTAETTILKFRWPLKSFCIAVCFYLYCMNIIKIISI